MGGPKQCYRIRVEPSHSSVFGVGEESTHDDSALVGPPESTRVKLIVAGVHNRVSAPQALFFSLGVLSLILRPASVPFVARQVHELAAAF